MAFQGQSIEDIYEDIKNRQTWVGLLSLINFDDEEYDVLLRTSCEIVRRYESWRNNKQHQARKVFLAFAIEYTRRKQYVQDKFWDEFLMTLQTGMYTYSLITEQLLWKTYHEEGIACITSGKGREFVLSLYEEVKASKTTSKECMEFFLWYYQKAKNSRITPTIITRYQTQRGQSLAIHEKAIDALDKDCQVLTKIIDYSIEHGIFLLRSNLETYSQKLIDGLGTAYDPLRLRLLRDRDMLRNIIIKLQYHRTPHQFLEELANSSSKALFLPNNSRLLVSLAHLTLKAETMLYGIYKLDTEEYRVVPFAWLTLETIAQWKYEEIIPLRNGIYIGYKKRQPFLVKIGSRTIEGRECILPNRDRCYIWADQILQGQYLLIDNHPYGLEGIDWSVSRQLGFNENKEPVIMLVIDSFKAFYPNNRGQPLSISTSQGHEETKYSLDNAEGKRELHRAISFPLYILGEPVTISVTLNKSSLASKTLTSAAAYLFSVTTSEHIPAGTMREWGEQNYYLFTSVTEKVIFGQGIVLDKVDIHLHGYDVYYVRWVENNLPFSLTVGQLQWNFERSRYLYVSVKRDISQNIIQLTGQQIHQFTQEHILIWTNQQLTESPSVKCYLQYADEEVKVKGGFQECENGLYCFNEEAIKDLNSLTVNRGCYGKFTLLFRSEKEILGQASITILPALTINPSPSTHILVEGKTLTLTVSSHLLRIWDSQKHRMGLSITVPVKPGLSVLSWPDNIQAPKGIRYLESQLVTFPVTFPALGETVEVKFMPSVFGFRLYQRSDKQATYQQVNYLDYHHLENSAIYIHTHEQKTIRMNIANTLLWKGNSNKDGYLLLENLSFLKSYCQEEQNFINLQCDQKDVSLLISWKPLIHKMAIEDNQILLEADGPYNTSILLLLMDLNGSIHKHELVICQGKEITIRIDLPSVPHYWKPYYITSQYQMTDGTLIPSIWQQRIMGKEVNFIPSDWFLKGVGLSSETLLKQ